MLSGVTARAFDDVWAVGYAPSRTSGHQIEPYVVHWDGRSWTRVGTPNGGANGTWLTDVAAAFMAEGYGSASFSEIAQQTAVRASPAGWWPRPSLVRIRLYPYGRWGHHA